MGSLHLCHLRASSGTEAVRPASTGSVTVACVTVGALEPGLNPWDPDGAAACGVPSRGVGVGGWPPAWLVLVVLRRCVLWVCTHMRMHALLKERGSIGSWGPCRPLLAAAPACVSAWGGSLEAEQWPRGLPSSFPLCTEDSFSTTLEGGRSQSSPHTPRPRDP